MISLNLLIAPLVLIPMVAAYAISTYRRNVAEKEDFIKEDFISRVAGKEDFVKEEEEFISRVAGKEDFVKEEEEFISRVAGKEDFISQLPDDILLSIITRVCTKVAIRTSILSKRWRDLYKFIPHIWLRFKDMYPHRYIINGKFSKIETFLSLNSGHRMPDIDLSFCSCVSCSSYMSKLHHLFYVLEKFGAESLYLNWIDVNGNFFMPSNMLPRLPSLELSTCTLQPVFLTQYRNSSLKFLTLRIVTLLPDSLRCVLFNCLVLESLSVSGCRCPWKLSISGPNLQLKTLIIKSCIGLEEVEIYATNLLRLECYGHTNRYDSERTNMINYIFACVPQLQTVYLISDKETSRMSSVLGTLAKDVPQLKSLTVKCESEIDCHQRRTGKRVMRSMSAVRLTTFRNLRQLAIFNPNLETLAPILQRCPLLEELQVNVNEYWTPSRLENDPLWHSLVIILKKWFVCLKVNEYWSNGERVRGEDGARLLELKRVKFSGFAGTKNDLQFCLYLLKSAVKLEEMLICRCSMVCHGDGYWVRGERDSRNPWSDELYKFIQQLQHKAISQAAQLNLVHVFP